MAQRHFTTGLPRLDEYLGGITRGDSILAFVSTNSFRQAVMTPLAAAAASGKTPVVYLQAEGGIPAHFSGLRKFKSFSGTGGKSKQSAILGAARRFVSANAHRSYILLEDLSNWTAILGNERRVIELFSELSSLADAKESVLVCTALRSAFRIDHLARLKDAATICLDILEHHDELVCVPLSMKGKYRPGSGLPFRLPEHERGGSTTPSNGEPAGAAWDQLLRSETLLSPPGNRYEKMFLHASAAMSLFELSGDYREFNEKAVEMLGLSRDELSVVNPLSLIPEEQRRPVLRALADLKRKKKVSLAVTILKKNGKQFPADIHISALGGSTFVCEIRDRTGTSSLQRLLQEREDEWNESFDRLPHSLLILESNKIIRANAAFIDAFGFTSSDDVHSRSFKHFLTRECNQAYQHALRKLQSDSKPVSCELTLLRSNGTALTALASFSKVHYHGKRCVQGLFIDVTLQQNLTERLSLSERLHRTLADRSPGGVSILKDGKFEYVNQAFLSMFGFESRESVVGQDYSIVQADPGLNWLAELSGRRGNAKNAPGRFEFRGVTVNGRDPLFEVVAVQPQDAGGSTIAYYQDRTEQERIKSELGRKRSELNLLEEFRLSIVDGGDTRKFLHHVAHKVSEVLSCEVAGVYLQSGAKGEIPLVHQKGMPETLAAKIPAFQTDEGIGGFLAKTMEPHVYAIDKYPSHLPYRSVFREHGLKVVSFVPLISGQKMVGVLLLGSAKERKVEDFSDDLLSIIGRQIGDVIAHSTRYQEIKSSEERYRGLVASIPDVLTTAQPSGTLEYISPAVEGLLGYQPREFYRNKSLWLGLVHPDDKRILLERTTGLQESKGKTLVSEYRVLPKGKASYRWVRDVLRVEYDSSGAISSLTGIISDITEQREQLMTLSAEDAVHHSILAGLESGVVAYDRNLKCIEWNHAMERMAGMQRASVLGKPASEIFPNPDAGAIDRPLRMALAGEAVPAEELSFESGGNGRSVSLWGNYSQLRDREGNVTGVVAIFSDTGKQKTLDGELHESERILRNIIDTMGDLLIITDLSGVVHQVNKAFLVALGYSRSEVLGLEFPHPWLLEEEMGRFVLWISTLREKNWLHDFDMTWKTKDGRRINMSLSTTLLRNSLGEPVAMLNIARDITERVRLARDLETRGRQIEMINRIIGKANQTMDFDDIFSAIADEINSIIPSDFINVGVLGGDGNTLEVYAVSRNQSLQKGAVFPVAETVSQFAILEKKSIVVPDLLGDRRYSNFRSVSKGMRSQLSIPISLKNRIFGTLNLGSREPFTYTEDLAVLLEPLAQHIGTIIDRIQLFKQVSEDSAYIHNLLDSLDSIVYTIDDHLRILEVNNAWHEFIRECELPARRDYHGLNLFEALPSHLLKVIIQKVVDRLLDGSLKIFSEEYVHRFPSGDRIYQLTVNPMIIKEKITGLVFTHTDITALKGIQEALRKNNEQLLALHEISTLISTSLNLEDILESAVPLVRKTANADAVLIYLKEREGTDLLLVKQVGFDDVKLETLLRLEEATSATGMVMKTKEPLYIESESYLDERIVPSNRETMRRLNFEALAIIPLISKDRVHGALDLFYRSPYAFSDRERQILGLIGNHLGSTIENAQLYGELRSQINRLTSLYELSQELTSMLEIDRIFQAVAGNVKHIVPFEDFRIDLYDPSSNTKTSAFHLKNFGPEVTASPNTQPVPVALNDSERQVVTSVHPFKNSAGTAMYVPMLSKTRILGIMAVHGNATTPYSETQLQLLESIANLTAIALEKGKLYEETLKISSEIQRRNKELDDFTYVVSHDLKEPLISVEGFSRILQADYHDVIQEEGNDYLNSMVAATARMKGLIDDLLMLSRVSRPAEAFKAVSVKQVIGDIVTDMEFTIQQKKVTLIIPDELPTVFGNATQLSIVFRNLIGNAIKFNNKPDPLVEIGFQSAENNSYLFSIRDNGIGIEKEFHEKIFVIFQRLHRREEYEGSGAGLAIVKKIIEIHKGKIWLESAIGKGSTFYFTIPGVAAHE